LKGFRIIKKYFFFSGFLGLDFSESNFSFLID